MNQVNDDKQETESIKSRAIVKYSVPKPPQFIKLEYNTNLNLPPSNWLSSSVDSYGFQHALYEQKVFSSFRMADMFPDCVGEVDVVTDAENIKNLLKMPYCKGQISMMVHRIENTLLLDDFDIYQHLLRNSVSEWSWLKKFFLENISHSYYDEDKNIYIKNRQREALKQKSLISKFLYHSLDDTNKNINENLEYKNTAPILIKGPLLPDPGPATPDVSNLHQKYNRNVVWTFEDIDMLVGTDMPIFGGGTHPCISLRLRDMNKPINVLTGIDYWLDNLMSNVPEVVMCYHLNGIVQKYELIKTEDLPRLNNSKFSPKLIRDVAQSILSFLKSNATKAGHTYWLFKGKDEEVVKLYDLTSLCSENDVSRDANPFTIPVAMLLYRVARNMKHNSNSKKLALIRMLLKNCIKLLPEDKYPEIVTSAHFMLADLYVPSNTDPDCPNLDKINSGDDSNSIFSDDDDDDDDDNIKSHNKGIFNDIDRESATNILQLDENNYNCNKFINYYKSPPPITGTLEELCSQAMQHIVRGIKCLKYCPIKNDNKNDNIKMANPQVPIPMDSNKNNSTIKTDNDKKKKRKNKYSDKIKALLKNNDNLPLLPNLRNKDKFSDGNIKKEKKNNNNNDDDDDDDNYCELTWKEHLKILLFEKSMLIYSILSEYYYKLNSFGNCLRTLGLLARCQLIMNKLCRFSNTYREICLLGKAGDCFIMIAQKWNLVDSYREQLLNSMDDVKMLEQLGKEEQYYKINIEGSTFKFVFIYDMMSNEQMFLRGLECYNCALQLNNDCEQSDIMKRMGNCLNEIGSHFMNKAKLATTKSSALDSCKYSEDYLMRSYGIFEIINDKTNCALINTNLAHLHRLLIHIHSPDERSELTELEKQHSKKAIDCYKKALQILNDRDVCPTIWDNVKWDLSSTLINMALTLQDFPSSGSSKNENEKQVIELFQSALQYCELNESSSKFTLYQYRVAIIHFRIGSLYHSHVWRSINDYAGNKNYIQLARINYEKAAKYYFICGDYLMYLKSQIQQIALFEYLSEKNHSYRLKHLQTILKILLETDRVIDLMEQRKIELSDEALNKLLDEYEHFENNILIVDTPDKFKNFKTILILMKDRLQNVLKNLIKYYLIKGKTNNNFMKIADIYKNCYKISLELGNNDILFEILLPKFNQVLKQIKNIVDECKIYE